MASVSDSGLYGYKDRPDLAPKVYTMDELYEFSDEITDFESVSIVISDKKLSKALKKNTVTYAQAELVVKKLTTKLNEEKLKIYFKMKDGGAVGSITIRGKPINLGQDSEGEKN